MELLSIYGPAHFGNFYECMSKTEARELFKEWKSWGINGIGTYFNPANAVDPFSQDPLYKWAREMPIMLWERKRKLLQAAQENGMKITLSLSPNVVYIDQLRPELAAETTSTEYIGPNLCPSKPEARKIILNNCKNLFEYIGNGGVSIDFILAFLRDWGGCNCKECSPWIKTYLGLWEDLIPILKKYHPNVKVQFCTWWMTEEELETICEYLKIQRPKWVDGINLSLNYSTEIPKVELPDGYKKTIFLHISYATTHLDKYGVKGGVVAPNRLDMIFKKLKDYNIEGFQAYSEGIYDDLNKFLVAHLGNNSSLNTRELVKDYCHKYFNINSSTDIEELVDAIYKLENLKDEEASKIIETLEKIGKKYNCLYNWKFALLLTRAKVGALEWQIGNKETWEREYQKLAPEERKRYIYKIDTLVEERRKVLDYLERYIYRVGAQCHVLDIDNDYKIWQEWKKGLITQEVPETFQGFIP
ncbi:MAG: hypothetical protein ACP5K2_09515 [bacterium]